MRQKAPDEHVVRLNVGQDLAADLARRHPLGWRGPVLARDAQRYYHLLWLERGRVAEMFNEIEWAVILSSLRRVPPQTYLTVPLWTVLEHAMKHRKIKKPKGFDLRAFLSKVGTLSKSQQFCLIDSVERWWCQRQYHTGATPEINPLKEDIDP